MKAAVPGGCQQLAASMRRADGRKRVCQWCSGAALADDMRAEGGRTSDGSSGKEGNVGESCSCRLAGGVEAMRKRREVSWSEALRRAAPLIAAREASQTLLRSTQTKWPAKSEPNTPAPSSARFSPQPLPLVLRLRSDTLRTLAASRHMVLHTRGSCGGSRCGRPCVSRA